MPNSTLSHGYSTHRLQPWLGQVEGVAVAAVGSQSLKKYLHLFLVCVDEKIVYLLFFRNISLTGNRLCLGKTKKIVYFIDEIFHLLLL